MLARARGSVGACGAACAHEVVAVRRRLGRRLEKYDMCLLSVGDTRACLSVCLQSHIIRTEALAVRTYEAQLVVISPENSRGYGG